MERLRFYIILFGITVLLRLAFLTSTFINPLINILFFLATFWFVFTTEANPEEDFILDVPEYQNYLFSRINMYGIGMAISTVIATIIFMTGGIVFRIDTSLLAILLWLALIAVSFFLARYEKDYEYVDAITFYILDQAKIKLNQVFKLRRLIKKFFKVKDFKKAEVKKLVEADKEFKDKAEQIIESFYLYLKSTEPRDEVTSDEVKELNKRS